MASFSLFRLGRFLRSILAPASATIGFACLLTFIFILYQPTPGPGAIQRLGWQSWDIISDDLLADNVDLGSTTTSPPSGGLSAPGDVGSGSGSGVDWWNVTAAEDPNEQFDAASLPLDVWDPLMPHDTGCECITLSLR